MKDNKKPRKDVLLAEQASEQGLEITVDSNAKHRARITRFGHLRQQSKDMSNWLFTQHDEASALDTPMGELMAKRFGHFGNLLSGCANYLLFKHYYTLDKYKLSGLKTCKSICYALSVLLSGLVSKLLPTMTRWFTFSKKILN